MPHNDSALPVVHEASANDAEAVKACVTAAFDIYTERIGKPAGPTLLDFPAEIEKGHVWVAELRGQVAGVLVQYETNQGFYIDTVAVVPPLQGTGIGKALLQFAEQEALRRGTTSVYLCTNVKMTENQVFYPRIGYVEYERKFDEGYDRIFYRKQLVENESQMNRSAWLTQERREAEEKYDTLWAPLYGEKYGMYDNAIHQLFIQKFLSLLPQHGIVLDAACGAGRYISMLREKGATVIGIDQSQGMLARAKARFPNVQVEKIGLQEMRYQEVFDGAICMDAMENVSPEDWPLVLGNFYRALKSKGVL